METTSDRNKETGASPTSTDQRSGEHREDGAAGAATELGRHYGEHGRPATASAGPPPQDAARGDEQIRSAVASGTEAAREIANRAAEQAGSVMGRAGETAQDLVNRAREQAGPAAQAVYDQGARAGQYVTRNVHEYPATALLIAAAVGYGLAYLIHGGGRSLRWGRHEFHNRYDQEAH